MHIFKDIDKANAIIDKFRDFYNTKRPHSSIGVRYLYECYFRIPI